MSNESVQTLSPQPWRAVGWSAVFVVLYLLVSFGYLVGYGTYLAVTLGTADGDIYADLIAEHLVSLDGMAWMYTLQTVVLLPFVMLISNFSTQSWRQTLAMHSVKAKTLALWFAVFLGYNVFSFAYDTLLDIPIDDFIYQMAGSRHWWLSFTVVLLAPIFEEAIFRGYLFKAFRHTWLGASGTIIVTSVLFTLIHAGQYSWLVMGNLFVLALILGIAREKTGSLWVPIFIHFLNNLQSTIFVTFLGLLPTS